ncbi:tRNA (guanosine(37)-N1)-methyltransferase TrmD [Candidatus Gracilibacteria bacterium CG2_30_37_12]|nr:MAG: tRNA (guanosine(37)-N1)-methyltransferase TrmD [Candidatus Gracilibacteria bacterium CG2_30_37_12]
MHFHIITLFPEVLRPYLETSIMGRAQEGGFVNFHLYNLADYSVKNTRRSDSRPYGGFPGTILAPEPLYNLITEIESREGKQIHKVFLTPRGELLNQEVLEKFSQREEKDLIIICGHYEGIDQRIIELFNIEEISIGEYVLSSGELSSLVFIDGMVRLIPGVISRESLVEESYSKALNGRKEYPHYTRPEVFQGLQVPKELISGNHKKIEEWKNKHTKI